MSHSHTPHPTFRDYVIAALFIAAVAMPGAFERVLSVVVPEQVMANLGGGTDGSGGVGEGEMAGDNPSTGGGSTSGTAGDNSAGEGGEGTGTEGGSGPDPDSPAGGAEAARETQTYEGPGVTAEIGVEAAKVGSPSPMGGPMQTPEDASKMGYDVEKAVKDIAEMGYKSSGFVDDPATGASMEITGPVAIGKDIDFQALEGAAGYSLTANPAGPKPSSPAGGAQAAGGYTEPAPTGGGSLANSPEANTSLQEGAKAPAQTEGSLGRAAQEAEEAFRTGNIEEQEFPDSPPTQPGGVQVATNQQPGVISDVPSSGATPTTDSLLDSMIKGVGSLVGGAVETVVDAATEAAKDIDDFADDLLNGDEDQAAEQPNTDEVRQVGDQPTTPDTLRATGPTPATGPVAGQPTFSQEELDKAVEEINKAALTNPYNVDLTTPPPDLVAENPPSGPAPSDTQVFDDGSMIATDDSGKIVATRNTQGTWSGAEGTQVQTFDDGSAVIVDSTSNEIIGHIDTNSNPIADAEEVLRNEYGQPYGQTYSGPKGTLALNDAAKFASITYAGYVRPQVAYTEKDVQVLAAVIEGECGVCTTTQKVAVADTVANRLYTGGFGTTITGVANKKGQFDACPCEPLSPTDPSYEENMAIARSVLDGTSVPVAVTPTGYAMNYYANVPYSTDEDFIETLTKEGESFTLTDPKNSNIQHTHSTAGEPGPNLRADGGAVSTSNNTGGTTGSTPTSGTAPTNEDDDQGQSEDGDDEQSEEDGEKGVVGKTLDAAKEVGTTIVDGVKGLLPGGNDQDETTDDTDFGGSDRAATAPSVSVAIQAEDFAYSRDEIHVELGAHVTITLTVTEGVHDLYIEDYGVRITPTVAGNSSSITFTADERGTFEFYSTIALDRNMGMEGVLVVE